MKPIQILVLAATLVVTAQTAPSQEVDQLTGEPPHTGTQLSLEPVSELLGAQDIIWDLTHGVYLQYEPAGTFAPLVSALVSAGYTVTTTTAGLDTIDLAPYQIIVVGVGSTYNSPYTPSEVAAIQAFVQAGGGLFLMADNTNAWPQNVDPVAQAFGVTTAQADPLGPFTDFDPHPVTTGVSQVTPLAPGSLAVSAPSMVIGRDEFSQPILTAAEVTLGKVVIYGDVNTCSDYIAEADNQLFCENVFGWLTTPVPVELQRFVVE